MENYQTAIDATMAEIARKTAERDGVENTKTQWRLSWFNAGVAVVSGIIGGVVGYVLGTLT